MKKILFVATIATLLAAGCQKTEILNHVPDNALTFSTQMAKLTKGAADDGEVNLKSQDFKVWAFTAFTDSLNNIKPGAIHEEIDGVLVDCRDDNKCYTPKEYYWPGRDLNLYFFALSSRDTTLKVEFSGKDNIDTLNRTMTIKSYTVDHTDPNDDLMVAEFVKQHQGMNKKAVNLHFKHALSKVVFKIETTEPTDTTLSVTDSITINSLKVNGLKLTGDLVVSDIDSVAINGENGRKAVALKWENVNGGDGTDEFFAEETALRLTGEAQDYATWLVMPQSISDLQMVINYTIKGTQGTEKPYTHIFALAQDGVTKWDINQVTVYTINISPNKISFTPSVQPWEPDTNVGANN